MKYLLLLLLTGCGGSVVIDNEIYPYVEEYKTLAKQYGKKFHQKNVDVVFGPTRPGTIAICYRNRKLVRINKTRWDTKTVNEKKWVVFHELAHCMHKQEHRGEWDGKKLTSLMYPSLGNDRLFREYEQYYIEELFR